MKNKIIYYSIAIALFLAFKVAYAYTTTNDLILLLKPTNTLVRLVTNSNASYASNAGFYHTNLNIVIDKSCSGFNFWMICFLMLTFLGLKYTDKTAIKLLTIPVILIISYIFTLFVNASRILFSLLVENQFNSFSIEKYGLSHQLEGIFIYLSFLILIYMGFEYALKKTYYAKFA